MNDSQTFFKGASAPAVHSKQDRCSHPTAKEAEASPLSQMLPLPHDVLNPGFTFRSVSFLPTNVQGLGTQPW